MVLEETLVLIYKKSFECEGQFLSILTNGVFLFGLV